MPLCLLLTAFDRVRKWMGGGRGPRRKPPGGILLIELAEMGTTVLAYPAVARLRATNPGSPIYFLVFKHIDESVRVLDLVPGANILTIDVSSAWTVCRDVFRFMRQARRLGIDTVINLEAFARFSTILSYLSGASTRVGFQPFTQRGLYVGDLVTHRVNYSSHIHTWQSLLALVKTLEADTADRPVGKLPIGGQDECVVPRVASAPEALAKLRNQIEAASPASRGKRLIAINPNASKLISIRKWPLEKYAELVGRLLENPEHACVITGLASERDDARFIVDRVNSDRLIDLTGQTTLRELIDLFNLAEVLVTNDSGPAHFAALTGIHVVVFFGPETPALYRPVTDRCTVLYSSYACSPCVSAYNQRRSICTDNKCLQVISTDVVCDTIGRVMAR